jgi:hypothetical protein
MTMFPWRVQLFCEPFDWPTRLHYLFEVLGAPFVVDEGTFLFHPGAGWQQNFGSSHQSGLPPVSGA